jgi:hypothetical protein
VSGCERGSEPPGSASGQYYIYIYISVLPTGESGSVTGLGQSTFSVNSNSTITPDSVSRVVDLDTLSTTEEVAQALIEFIATR